MNKDDVSDRSRSIQINLDSIVVSSSGLLQRLKNRERSVRIASSLFTGFLGFGIIVIIGSILSQSTLYYMFVLNPKVGFAVLASALFAVVAGGIITYILLKRRHEAPLKELSSLIVEMKTTGQQSLTGHGIIEDAISLVDKITTLLPELVRKRHEDSLLFGAVAFIIPEILTRNLLASVLIGALVWLYFRYENSKTYEREISKLELQRRDFEERRNDLIKTLNSLA